MHIKVFYIFNLHISLCKFEKNNHSSNTKHKLYLKL